MDKKSPSLFIFCFCFTHQLVEDHVESCKIIHFNTVREEQENKCELTIDSHTIAIAIVWVSERKKERS